MANLDALMKMHRHGLEERQKKLAELYQQAGALEGQKDQMLSQLAKEKETAQSLDVGMLSYFGPYSDAVKDEVEEIDKKLVMLEKRIEFAREDMRAAFAELKKIEITQDRRKAEAAKEQLMKEIQELDEIALQSYRRKISET